MTRIRRPVAEVAFEAHAALGHLAQVPAVGPVVRRDVLRKVMHDTGGRLEARGFEFAVVSEALGGGRWRLSLKEAPASSLRIEWRSPSGAWVEAREPAYMPDGTVKKLSVEERWALVKAGARNQVSEHGHAARLVRDGVVVEQTGVPDAP